MDFQSPPNGSKKDFLQFSRESKKIYNQQNELIAIDKTEKLKNRISLRKIIIIITLLVLKL